MRIKSKAELSVLDFEAKAKYRFRLNLAKAEAKCEAKLRAKLNLAVKLKAKAKAKADRRASLRLTKAKLALRAVSKSGIFSVLEKRYELNLAETVRQNNVHGPSYLPTEAEIAEECKKIQSCWSAAEMEHAVRGESVFKGHRTGGAEHFGDCVFKFCRCGAVANRPYADYLVCNDCYKELFSNDKHVCPGNGRSVLHSDEDGVTQNRLDQPVWWEQIG